MRIRERFNPRAPCGARRTCRTPVRRGAMHFNPRAPCGARRRAFQWPRRSRHFNPRAPCGARPEDLESPYRLFRFQPTRPLRGATILSQSISVSYLISTHAPLAGRDIEVIGGDAHGRNFNPRAPCGARQQKCTNHYAHFCDNRQISDAFAQNAACQGILLLFDAGKPCGFWVRTAQVISAHLCFAL